MRAPCSIAALFYALVSLLLVQVLAAAPQANSQSSARSNGIDARDAISWLKAQRTEDARPRFEARLPTSDASRNQIASREARHTPGTPAAPVGEVKARIPWSGADERSQALMVIDREPATVHPVATATDPVLQANEFVVRSEAPKVFGVNIFLIIAWLALMYLMYRTGSI